MTSSAAESDIVVGGETLIITLTDDTWVAADGTFDAQRQNIIDGLDSAQSETYGWNNEVRDKQGVANVVRTSDTVVTITLDAQSAYAVSANETITVTVPAAALVTSTVDLTASPTFSVTAEAAGGSSCVQVATGRFTLRTGTGTQAITGVGFQPKAYVLFYTKNASDDANSGDSALLSIGMTDGTTQFAMASGAEDNLGSSDVGRRGFSGAVLATHDGQGAQEVEGKAAHSSLDSDGFTINVTTAFATPASPLVHYIAFGGDDLSADVGTVDLNNTQNNSEDVTAPGFEPDVVLTSYIGVFQDVTDDADNDDHSFSLGWAVNPDRQASNNQYSMMVASQDGQGTTQTKSRFDSNYAGTSYRDNAIDAGFEIGSFDADGFSVTTRLTGAATNEIMGYLALKLGSDPEVYTVARTARTSTGDDVESGAGFEPIFLLGIGGGEVTSADTNTDGGSIAIGMTDGTNSCAIRAFGEDGAGNHQYPYPRDQHPVYVRHRGRGLLHLGGNPFIV